MDSFFTEYWQGIRVREWGKGRKRDRRTEREGKEEGSRGCLFRIRLDREKKWKEWRPTWWEGD